MAGAPPQLLEFGQGIDGVRARVELGTGDELGEHTDAVHLLDDQADLSHIARTSRSVERAARRAVHRPHLEQGRSDVAGQRTDEHARHRVADQHADQATWPDGGGDAGECDRGVIDRLEHAVGQDEVERRLGHDLRSASTSPCIGRTR